MNAEDFIPPEGAVLSNGTMHTIETKQVDRLLIENLDVRGGSPSIGTLSSTQLVGLNMASNIVINGQQQNDGVTYMNFEVMEVFLGDGKDAIDVVSTSVAMHYLDLGDEDDYLRIKDVSGPFIVYGNRGNDTFTVMSDDSKVDKIQALVAFDGGPNEGTEMDKLTIDNSGDTLVDDVLKVTRFIVETESMAFNTSSSAPGLSYLINLRNATGGNFTLEIYDPETTTISNQTFDYPLAETPYDSAKLLESKIQRMIIPEEIELGSCGELNTSKCSSAVKVWSIGDAFAVFIAGERLGDDVDIKLYTDSLEGFDSEMYLNETNDILRQNSDVAYANLEELDILMGDIGVVVNARGTCSGDMSGDLAIVQIAYSLSSFFLVDRYFCNHYDNDARSRRLCLHLLRGKPEYHERSYCRRSAWFLGLSRRRSYCQCRHRSPSSSHVRRA